LLLIAYLYTLNMFSFQAKLDTSIKRVDFGK